MANVTHDLRPNRYLVTHAVGPNQAGTRLDSFLRERYRRRSRETLKRAIESGAITLRRSQGPHLTVGRLKPGTQLIPGDEVLVLSERKAEPEVNFQYTILFEDEGLLVIDKPANLPVHPAGRYFFNSLLIHLRTHGHRGAEAAPAIEIPAQREYFLVHRIDKETSGILVLAKSREACVDVTRQFAARETEKRYLAVVRGIPADRFECALPMRRARNSRIALRMEPASSDDGGQPAYTEFRRLESARDCALVECRPRTGRQHQIRVHLESLGHPLVGDKLYGVDEEFALLFFERERLTPEAEARLLLPRHALHAAGIRFRHPLSGRPLEFESPLPADLRQFLDDRHLPPSRHTALLTAVPCSRMT